MDDPHSRSVISFQSNPPQFAQRFSGESGDDAVRSSASKHEWRPGLVSGDWLRGPVLSQRGSICRR